ncbi:hypothetical protein T261_0459 [Streptomyces lydicus]|nr:hypothetical protein T261_0459 [Streptomyces lydicus]
MVLSAPGPLRRAFAALHHLSRRDGAAGRARSSLQRCPAKTTCPAHQRCAAEQWCAAKQRCAVGEPALCAVAAHLGDPLGEVRAAEFPGGGRQRRQTGVADNSRGGATDLVMSISSDYPGF